MYCVQIRTHEQHKIKSLQTRNRDAQQLLCLPVSLLADPISP